VEATENNITAGTFHHPLRLGDVDASLEERPQQTVLETHRIREAL